MAVDVDPKLATLAVLGASRWGNGRSGATRRPGVAQPMVNATVGKGAGPPSQPRMHSYGRTGPGAPVPAAPGRLPGSLQEFWAGRHFRALRAIQAANRALVSRPVDEVCVYWLTDMCVAGDRCRFLHMYIDDKLPRCKYVARGVKCPDGVRCVYQPCCRTATSGPLSFPT